MPRSIIAGCIVVASLVFKETAKPFSKVPNCFPFTFPPAMHERSSFSISSLGFGVATISYFGHSDRCVTVSHCGFDLHFLITVNLFSYIYIHIYGCFWGKKALNCSLIFISYMLFLCHSFHRGNSRNFQHTGQGKEVDAISSWMAFLATGKTNSVLCKLQCNTV